MPIGDATITIDDTTLPENSQLTVGLNPSDVTVVAGQDNDAGKDGYYVTVKTYGSVSGTVVMGRLGLKDVLVQITDIEGIVHSTTTNGAGVYNINDIPTGVASVLTVDTSVPNAVYVPTPGSENPTSVTVLENETVNAGIDYYTYTY